GLGVRLIGVLGIIFVLHLWLGIYRPGSPAEGPGAFIFLSVVMVFFSLHAARRRPGLRAWLRRQLAAARDRKGFLGTLTADVRVQPSHDGAALAGPLPMRDDLAGFPMARADPHWGARLPSLLVSGRFPMIYVVDAKFFESTAGDAGRCREAPPGGVRDGARVKSPEPVMRRLPRRKVK